MNRSKLELSSPLPQRPDGATLRAALLTSFRPVSPTFLLGEILPQLLNTRGDENDAAARDWFIAEAMNALEPLRGYLTVITSGPTDDAHTEQETWLNQYVTRCTVGAKSECIQHAKLWLCHWQTDNGELLQVTVSSTNLTPDAFNGQVQSGWTATLPIEKSAVLPRRKSLHTELGLFLSELGNEANCEGRTSYFCEILTRCKRIEGSHFVASIPRSNAPLPFAALKTARGLSDAFARLKILTPSIGYWDSRELSDLRGWCAALGIRPTNINVIWPANDHPWTHLMGSEAGTWTMPKETCSALKACTIGFLKMPSNPNDEAFDRKRDGGDNRCGKRDGGDKRWWHAKFYEFDEGLLLGSHNWSKSAWGIPKKQLPKNFELSVFVTGGRVPLPKDLPKLSAELVLTNERKVDLSNDFWLRWACATWDGEQLVFKFRVSAGTSVDARWCRGQSWAKFERIDRDGKQWKWKATKNCKAFQPGFVSLSKSGSGSSIKIAVFDIREGDALPYGLSAAIQQSADLLLLESYGGPIAVDPPFGRAPRKMKRALGNAESEDANYRPDWLASSRYWCTIVDKWREKWTTHPCAATLHDAKRLARAILTKDGGKTVGAKIAIEELLSLSESKIDC